MNKYKICLDAGHGGHDPGAINGSRKEKDDVLRFTLALGGLLSAEGIQISYTRSTDRYVSPSAKADLANASRADLLVSIHRNAAALSARGVEVLVYSKSGKAANLAGDLCNKYRIIGFVYRGIKVRTDLAVLKRTKMPAVLLELGFISNIEDNQLFDSEFEDLVQETADSILQYFGMQPVPAPIKNPEWINENGRWWYRHTDGSYTRNDWEKINGRWYRFDSEGWMLTGKQVINGELFYLCEDKSSNEGACMVADQRGVLRVWEV